MASTRQRARDLDRLKQVTEAAWLAASQGLRQKAGEERAAATHLAALSRDRNRFMALLAAPGADTAQAVATTRWLRWADSERARQNTCLARLRADLAREQAGARKAFSRDQALGKLLAAMRQR